jgi:hypothetical protein
VPVRPQGLRALLAAMPQLAALSLSAPLRPLSSAPPPALLALPVPPPAPSSPLEPTRSLPRHPQRRASASAACGAALGPSPSLTRPAAAALASSGAALLARPSAPMAAAATAPRAGPPSSGPLPAPALPLLPSAGLRCLVLSGLQLRRLAGPGPGGGAGEDALRCLAGLPSLRALVLNRTHAAMHRVLPHLAVRGGDALHGCE